MCRFRVLPQWGWIRKLALTAALVAVAVPSLAAGTFPTKNDDRMTSLGQFRIFVRCEWRPLVAGYPGYNPATYRLESPLLFDPETKIGRSTAFTEGSPADTGGIPVGTANTLVKDSHLTYPPGDPAWNETPGPRREIHTEVRSINLTSGPVWVHAGAEILAPGSHFSPGEVESWNAVGDSANDLPARSFFNVFCEVFLPGLGGTGGIIYNRDPLIIKNANVQTVPPRVVYEHGNSGAVPVYFKADNLPYWKAGDLFGYLVLAGHGASYGDNASDRAEFGTFYNSFGEMPLPNLPSITPWALAFLTLVLLSFGAWYLRRRVRTAQGTT